MSQEAVAGISDPAVRGLVESALRKGAFEPQAALAEAPPEIRDAVARALLSEEYATDDEKQKLKLLAELSASLAMPNDLHTLEAERNLASQRGDLERVNQLNVKIRSLLRSRPSTRIQGEQSR